MSDLEELERERGNSEYVDVGASTGSLGSLTNYGARTASNEMCTFLVMNISSLQLTSEYHRVSQPIWKCQSGGSHCACGCGDVF